MMLIPIKQFINICFIQEIFQQSYTCLQYMQQSEEHKTKQMYGKEIELIEINELMSKQDKSACTYCFKNQSSAWSMIKSTMHPYTYQLLAERGWRRCGTYYYKPDLHNSCCKLYTHRLNTKLFKISKDQKKTIRKMIQICYECVESCEKLKPEKNEPPSFKIVTQVGQENQMLIKRIIQKINVLLQPKLLNLVGKDNLINQNAFNWNIIDKIKSFVSKPQQKADYYCNYVMLLYGYNKKVFKKQRYNLSSFVKDIKQKIQQIGNNEQYKVQVQKGGYLMIYFGKQLKEKTQQQFQRIQFIQSVPQKKSEEKMKEFNQQKQLNPPNKIKEFFTHLKEKIIGESKIEQPKLKKKKSSQYQKLNIQYKGQIEITANLIKFGKLIIQIVKAEQSSESFKLYHEYCLNIHEKSKDKMSSYVNFLCLNALKIIQETSSQKGGIYIPSWDSKEKYQKGRLVHDSKRQMGCHHMKYYLEGRLIGVGVVDILPQGLSSVYFFYSPEFKDRRLGVFSSLMEIQYVRHMQLSFPAFRYYYMGFHIENNHKMDYKVNYKPCELLCPQTYRFEKLTEDLREKVKLAQCGQGSVRLSPLDTSLLQDMQLNTDPGVYIDKHVKMTYHNNKITLKNIRPQFFIPILSVLKQFIAVWGKTLFQIFQFTL